MISNTVYVKSFEAPPVDKREILRYAGARDSGSELVASVIDECIEEALRSLTYQVCYRVFSVSEAEGALNLGFAVTDSETVHSRLCGCDYIVLFGATIGVAMDRLIAKYSRIAPSRALLMQAIGTERIEALCDSFDHFIADEMLRQGKRCHPRFSPGYGDFPLLVQRSIIDALDCSRKIGIGLTESLMMTPSKSVTALIGVSEQGMGAEKQEGCVTCKKQDCSYRRTE